MSTGNCNVGEGKGDLIYEGNPRDCVDWQMRGRERCYQLLASNISVQRIEL